MKKKFILILSIITLLLTSNLYGQWALPEEGSVYKSLKADLNKDGSTEKIILKVYGVNSEECTWFGQLIVLNSSGTVIWAGPKSKDRSNPLVFGCWDYGDSLPLVIGDLDRDGNMELLSSSPVSDVRYTPFKLFRWDGKKFYALYKKVTLVESPSSSGKYPWGNDEGYMGRWISNFKSSNGDGTYNVDIFEYTSTSSKSGEAIVKSDSNGFHISKWIKSPK